MELTATNPLDSPLVLSDIRVFADRPEAISVDPIPEITLDPYETRLIRIAITASKAANMTVEHVSFMYHRFFPCTQSLQRRGKRLHTTKAQRLKAEYADDKSLTIVIEEAKPCLTAQLVDVPKVLYAGEEVEAAIILKNTGKIAVEEVQLLLSETGMIRLRNPVSESRCFVAEIRLNRSSRRYRS